MLKTLLITVSILLCARFAGAQVYVDGVNMNADTSVQYIEVVHSAYPAGFVIGSIDVGKGTNGLSRFTDSLKKRLKIESGIQLEQYFKRNGWKLVRRDLVFKVKEVETGSGYTLVFLLFEKTEAVE